MTLTTAAVESATAPSVSPFRVDRVAGISSSRVDLDLAEARDAAAALDDLDAQVQQMTGPITDMLFTAVASAASDKTARRALLDARRSAHDPFGQPMSQTKLAVASEAVGRHLGPQEAVFFDSWATMRRRRTAMMDELEVTFGRELEEASQTLGQLLADPLLATGIAQASPHLGRTLAAPDLRPGSKSARSFTAYTTRAAFKTSPFSTLTSVCLAGAEVAVQGEELTVSQSHLNAWLDSLAANEDCIGAFHLEALPTPGVNPADGDVTVPVITSSDNFSWRTDKQVSMASMATLLSRLQFMGRQPAKIYLQALGGADPFAMLRRLIDVNVVRVVAPWGYGDRDKIGSLIRALNTHGSPAALQAASQLTEMQGSIKTLSSLTGRERAAALLTLANSAESALQDRGCRRADASFTLFSDATPTFQTPAFDAADGELASLGEALRPYIFRSHVYDWLRGKFVERFGTGATCTNVLGFLRDLAADRQGAPGLLEATRLDASLRGRPTERAWLPVGNSTAPPALAVMYQMAAHSQEELENGNFTMVVNQFNPGLGGLVARFQPSELGSSQQTDDGVRDHLRGWATGLYPGAKPLEFVPSSGVNTMQAGCEGTFPRIGWPTELPVGDGQPGALAVDELVLIHRGDTDVMDFAGPHGEPVAPMYMGLVPQHLLTGPERFLAELANPWVNGATFAMHRLPTLPPEGAATTVSERRQYGRIVTRRRSWTMPLGRLPLPTVGELDVSYFRRINSWRRTEGLPEHVFLHLRSAMKSASSPAPKPVWISFTSQHCLAQFKVLLLGEADGATFTEVLPDTPEQWLLSPDDEPHSVEHISFLRWERPQPHPAPVKTLYQEEIQHAKNVA